MGSDEICKVSDFGLLHQLPGNEDYIVMGFNETKSPVRWMAPESLADNKFSSASDVWSFGILVWEMFNPRSVPFEEYNSFQVVFKVTNALTPGIPDNCPDNITRMMKFCWNKEPPKRPSFLLLVKVLTEFNKGNNYSQFIFSVTYRPSS